jgi:fructose-1,6-bisphosphatase/inositol monophosphatase family enzyme
MTRWPMRGWRRGSLDLVIESGLKRHDWAALVPVVRGAGGVIGDWQGGSDFERGDRGGGDAEPCSSRRLL